MQTRTPLFSNKYFNFKTIAITLLAMEKLPFLLHQRVMLLVIETLTFSLSGFVIKHVRYLAKGKLGTHVPWAAGGQHLSAEASLGPREAAEPGTTRHSAPSGCAVGKAPAHVLAENFREEVSSENPLLPGAGAALSGSGESWTRSSAREVPPFPALERGSRARACAGLRACFPVPSRGASQSPFDLGPHPPCSANPAPRRSWTA